MTQHSLSFSQLFIDMYTLEKHLQSFSSESSQFELLNSIWKLNKQYIPSAQSAINFNFPHYSLHEKSHSETIVKNIESFLGEERIKSLSPTDAWMILMAAFTHDLGMVIFHTALEKEWIENDFQDYLRRISEYSSDKDLLHAANLLLKIQNQTQAESDKQLNLPLEIRKAVILITADFFRKNHHKRSRDIINGADIEFSSLINKFNLHGIPNRFSNVLSEIAFGHGIEFYSILERLDYIADGIGSDKMHPRFIAYLLRLGDLLDVDDKRFNIFNEKVYSKKMPDSSRLHEEKHASIRHLLISPESIEVTVDCKSDEVYRIAREWFDWLQQEVENQSKEWSNIAPKNLRGMPPTISRGKVKVLYKSAEPQKELMNLRFSISNEKVFEMFEGSAIYDNAELVFLREILQNAIDASKIQLWKLVNSGVYDYLIRQRKEWDLDKNHEDIINSIKFPSDIPKEIWQNFEINLNINWKDDTKEILVIELEDFGTGISESDLIRMTHKVGESRKNDEDFQKFKKSIPYWLKPTGAFGIGLQSLFLIVNSFKVQTKAEGEEGMEIIFTSAKKGEYSKITDNKPSMHRGTKVILEIPQNRFPEIFNSSFNYDTIEQFDIFSDKYGNIYLHKIKEYILKEFNYIEQLNVNLINERIKSSTLRTPGIKLKDCPSEADNALKLYIVKPEEFNDSHRFIAYENISIGSEINLFFNNSIQEDNLRRDSYRPPNSSYLVRDIPVKEDFPSYYKTAYCYVLLNFQSHESDKILNISRDKFIKKMNLELERKFLDDVYPKVIEKSLKLFECSNSNNNSHQVGLEYFHLEITALMCGLKPQHLSSIYRDFELPEHIATLPNLGKIKLIDFIKAKRIMLFDKNYFPEKGEQLIGLKREFGSLNITEIEGVDAIVWDKSYFKAYFKLCDFQIEKKLSFSEANGTTYIQVLKQEKNVLIPVECNTLYEKLYLNSFNFTYKRRNRRVPLFPLKKYSVLAVKTHYDGFLDGVDFIKHLIVSPFKNYSEYFNLKKALDDQIRDKNRAEIINTLKREHIQNIIPQNLAEFILKNSSCENQATLTQELIIDTYVELITDALLVNFDDDIPLKTELIRQGYDLTPLTDEEHADTEELKLTPALENA